MKIKGWVGMCDGQLHVFRDWYYTEGHVMRSDFFASRKAARLGYSNVRRATLIIEEPKRRKRDATS